MATDRCTNRKHMLATPPSSRKLRRAPRDGCMPCREYVTGECPYRKAYECTQEVRELGLAIGHCAVEQVIRDRAREEAAEFLGCLDEERPRAELLMELWLDAYVYAHRARAWQWMMFNREPSDGGYDLFEEEHARAWMRYSAAGSERMLKWWLRLKPYLDLANRRRRRELRRGVEHRASA